MNTPSAPPTSPPHTTAPQRIVNVRREYNRWVTSETLEDYALRYTPQRGRIGSMWRVANTAFGVASFLVLEAVGATLLVQYGFINACWAILAAGLIIFLAGLPISVYAARYGVDMDLLTRGAGFGYIGSTLTSLLYASFTFIFFALEAAIMAYALELTLGIPAWGYLLCALVVIPFVMHGMVAISRFQVWTQPLWLLLLLLPYGAVWWLEPGAWVAVTHYSGALSSQNGFDWHLFGAGLTVGVALITQMGEQADYLRFMPQAQPGQSGRWWLAVLVGGPGWVIPGVLKMLGGAVLAGLALSQMVPPERAVDPNQMYLVAWETLLPYPWAVWATAALVIVSQLKINVTNAYAGSLAWSNFFSRLTHSHPGRVVWVLFNTAIALMLMEMNLFQVLGDVLGLYANLAIAWIMAVVADLVINKPLGWSPPGIEFRRAYLYDINPVGVGAMLLASALSVAAHLGLFGHHAQAFSALVALVTALITSPVLAWWTQGRYYLARPPETPVLPSASEENHPVSYRCVVCERDYEAPDTAHCTAYQGRICSLCCTLDARCGDHCKPHASLSSQWSAALRRLTPPQLWPHLAGGLTHYLLLMPVVALLLAGLVGLLYRQEWNGLSHLPVEAPALEALQQALRTGYLKVYAALLLLFGIVAWWLVLAQQSRSVAQEESNRQTGLLLQEIASHQQTDSQLQQARQVAEAARAQADQANQAKTRYISNISHELRTPLNSILGYAQLLQQDEALQPRQAHAIRVILRSGEHLLSLIEGTLDIARIEAGKLTLQQNPVDLRALLEEVTQMFELQAAAKNLRFEFQGPPHWPSAVKADEKRLRQILINLLGNAVKFTSHGQVGLRLHYVRQMAIFEISDTGPGMSANELAKVFEPFARAASAAHSGTPGSGLGLTIANMLTELMGGELSAQSEPGQGTLFRLRLFLPELQTTPLPPARKVTHKASGYVGRKRHLLVVDNEETDRQLLANWLEPLGFGVHLATHGEDALQQLQAGLHPDAVFMDLAMPGMDGWETLRRIQALSLQPPPALAVVSANAFDKGLENDVGLPPEDFLVKPVRRSDILDWLQHQLALEWHTTRPEATHPSLTVPTPNAPAHSALPTEALQSLLELAQLGYYRGFVKRASSLQLSHPESAAWLGELQTLAREFRFETISATLAPLCPPFRLKTHLEDVLVLLVDDMPDNIAALHDALDDAGYTVLVALDGQTALERATQAHPDVILLDAMMPGLDGFEVARRLKAQAATADIPILFMTGLTETEHLVAALTAGGVDYVTKPVKPVEVMARMGVHLRAARQAQQGALEQQQARNALDAFGYATITVRARDGRLMWQTPLARELLLRHCGTQAPHTPTLVLQWLQRHLPEAQQHIEPPRLHIDHGNSRLTFRLHRKLGEEESSDDSPEGEWLIVMEESSDGSAMEALAQAFSLTAREAEVLYWVAQGKINRDIADILGASPATVKKHLERIHAKLGVETRTAAAAMAVNRVRALQRG